MTPCGWYAVKQNKNIIFVMDLASKFLRIYIIDLILILHPAPFLNFSPNLVIPYFIFFWSYSFFLQITTHMELKKKNMLSFLGNLIPFSDFNQSPRNMYQCQVN